MTARRPDPPSSCHAAQATVPGLEAHAGRDRLEPELRGLRLDALYSLDAVADRLATQDPGDLETIAERHAARLEAAPLDLAVVASTRTAALRWTPRPRSTRAA